MLPLTSSQLGPWSVYKHFEEGRVFARFVFSRAAVICSRPPVRLPLVAVFFSFAEIVAVTRMTSSSSATSSAFATKLLMASSPLKYSRLKRLLVHSIITDLFATRPQTVVFIVRNLLFGITSVTDVHFRRHYSNPLPLFQKGNQQPTRRLPPGIRSKS